MTTAALGPRLSTHEYPILVDIEPDEVTRALSEFPCETPVMERRVPAPSIVKSGAHWVEPAAATRVTAERAETSPARPRPWVVVRIPRLGGPPGADPPPRRIARGPAAGPPVGTPRPALVLSAAALIVSFLGIVAFDSIALSPRADLSPAIGLRAVQAQTVLHASDIWTGPVPRPSLTATLQPLVILRRAERRAAVAPPARASAARPNVPRQTADRPDAASHEKDQVLFAGSLAVESEPAGAQVVLDGRTVGTTPLILSDVKIGSRVLRVEHEGYERWTSVVRVVADTRSAITAALKPQKN